jgi:hypothetical protein
LEIGKSDISKLNLQECPVYVKLTYSGTRLMAQLEAFKIPGFVLEMYPEDHSPPHFHVIKKAWNIRIKFNLSIVKREIIWDSKYPKTLKECPLSSRESKEFLELMQKNSKALNRQWHAMHPSKHEL